MTGRDDIILEITPHVLLKAYAVGIFPMAESADDPGLYWIEPEARGIIPLERFHVPRRFRLRGGDCRLRRGLPRPRQDVDQCPHPPALWRAFRPRSLSYGRGLAE